MAKFGERVASVFFLGLGAFLLGRRIGEKGKENAVGAIPSTILIDGDFLLVKEIALYLEGTPYIDTYKYKEAKDGVSLSLGYTYSTLKETKDIFNSLVSTLERDYEIKKWKIGENIEYVVSKNGKRAKIVYFKGGMF